MLAQRRKFQALVLFYRCINKQAPPYIQEIFNIYSLMLEAQRIFLLLNVF